MSEKLITKYYVILIPSDVFNTLKDSFKSEVMDTMDKIYENTCGWVPDVFYFKYNNVKIKCEIRQKT